MLSYVFDFDCTLTSRNYYLFMFDHNDFFIKYPKLIAFKRYIKMFNNAINSNDANVQIKKIVIDIIFGSKYRFEKLIALLSSLDLVYIASRGNKQ